MVEREQPLVEKSMDELDHEERVARGLLVHQLRQRGGARPLAAKRIRNELSHVLTGEGRELDFLHERSRVPDRLELQHQRMGGADFIVAIRTDQHEVPQIRPGEHVLEQEDRKSTRLNSSHSQISYAVFCLKKKKKLKSVPLHVQLAYKSMHHASVFYTM